MRTGSTPFHCLLLTLAVALVACTENPTGPTIIIPADSEAVVYSKHIQPIFVNSCGGSGCHLSGDNTAGLRLDSWQHLMEGTDDYGAQVVPYSAVHSHLFQHLNTDTTIGPVAEPHMPLGRDPLPADQLRTIKRWIDEGAKNDDGTVMYAASTGPRLFVTAQSEDGVTVIDVPSRHVMRFIPVGTLQGGAPESPHNIVLSPDKRYLYVNLIVGGTVEKYDAATFQKIGQVRVGLSPAQVAVTSDGAALWVSNFDKTLSQRFIVRVDAATMRVTDTVFDVGAAPHGIILSPDERHVYTCNALSDDISEIDTQTKEVTRRILMSPNNPLKPGVDAIYQPYQAVFGADGKLWVTCRDIGQVRVVDLAAGTVVDSISVQRVPLILAMTPNKGELWVPNQFDSTISIISTGTHKITATITGLNTQPHAVVFTADGATAFVSCENQNGSQHHATSGSSRAPGVVYEINVATRAIVRRIEVGSFAAGLVISE